MRVPACNFNEVYAVHLRGPLWQTDSVHSMGDSRRSLVNADGSVSTHNGLAINTKSGIAMFAIANPYGRFGEVPLRWRMTAMEWQPLRC